jgi:hypothetical protein
VNSAKGPGPRLPRRETALILAAYAIATVAFWTAIGISGRHPLNWTALLVCYFAFNVGAGVLLKRWAALWLTLVVATAGLLAEITAGLITLAFFDNVSSGVSRTIFIGSILALVVTPVIITLGVLAGKAADDKGVTPFLLVVASYVCIAGMAIPLAMEIINRHRTVHFNGTTTIQLDEQAGTANGVGLGASREQVEAVFGPDPTGAKFQNSLDYDGVSFDFHEERVTAISTHHGGAETTGGVSVGDSLSIAQDAYATLSCTEVLGGSVELTPDPSCEAATGPGVKLHIDADYDQPGVPIIGMWMRARP